MQKLINSVQHYAWGSKTALTELYGIANPTQQPMAELWMGAHPKSSSQVQGADGQPVALRDVIEHDKSALLGDAVAKRFGELPFLFKVLCAAQPLSIQVHPNKHNSEIGFAKENAAGIPMDAAERNYKDPNHKPELVFALTPFLAMNAFREFSDIVALLQPVAGAHPAIAHFLQEPGAERLSYLFSSLLNMQDQEKSHALAILKSALNSQQGEPWQTIRLIADVYPNDSGLFSPLLLNVVKLNPGEAMFLFAETPHAYLQGVALEVMANSDNVLRAGLTPKYIDIPELVANVKFVAKPANQLLTTPVKTGGELDFPIPVDDFAFSLHELSAGEAVISQHSAAILFCIEGEALLSKGDQRLVLKPGESAFISANESPISVSGVGRLARVYNKL
ncbi:mannose-6-phosphate isomerase [Citrobacter sp. RHBSTW-00671]|uniref:mannose-6-phosphate isomerase n=1 Tax=Citrobacter sp. RHBSTW-00671 TaxID=2742660 RepID=UPI001837877F|nr:mannose-6-phosphate isomerase [Citrobacter sp. RHBSTW-00671]MBA7967600.1 mannose-6-phosphate isomerase [Citrobacter sp. RHBSTW-00671]